MNVIVEQKFVFSFFAVFCESPRSERVEQFVFVVSPDRHQLANCIGGVGSRIVTQGPRYETSQKLRNLMDLQSVICAIARAVALHHFAQIFPEKLRMGERFGWVDQTGVFIHVPSKTADPLEDGVPLVNALDVFAYCFLSRQIEHRRANVLGEIWARSWL